MTRRRGENQRGIALLMVISAIAVLALVLIDFSNNARTHMNAGVNMRDEMRATNLADTALVMTRACMDDKAWGPVAAMRSQVDLEKLCTLLLNVFIKNRIDLPLGGLSVPLEGIDGLGLSKGEVEELSLQPENAFIGLAGLWCGNRAQINCTTRRTVVAQLRSLLCDPSISWWFESERSDGNKYTRGEIIGNLIDWVDSDDNRINIDESNWSLVEGAGEGEDAYYRDSETPYRSKDAPFDTLEELRMVKGIDDDLFDYLRDRVSVYALPRVDINTAKAEVFSSILRANSQFFTQQENMVCGEETNAQGNVAQFVEPYARLIAQARTLRLMQKLQSGGFMSPAFKTAQEFQQILQDPASFIANAANTMASGFGGLWGGGSAGFNADPKTAAIISVGLSIDAYNFVQSQINWQGVMRSVTVGGQIFRLTVKGRVGNMSRTMVAVLKRDGQTVRTLYYREE